jgi:amino acid adenylation domain-containing protein
MTEANDPAAISRFGHATLPDALEFAAKEFGDQTIVHVSAQDGSEDEQTYRSLASEARKLAELLASKGWRPGQRLIFVVSASRLFATSFWGCLLAGVVPVPLSPLMNREPDSMEAEKIRNVIKITGAPVLFDSRLDGHAALLSEIVESAGGSLHYADELVREAMLGHFDAPPLPEIVASDVAVLQFSSGSSGLPKGVRLTHRNIIANIEGQIDVTEVTRDDVLCTWLPYFHDFGLFWGHLSALYLGMKQVRLDPGHFARRPLVWLEKLDRHRATITNTTPTALNHLLGYMELKQRKGPVGSFDLSSLKTMLVGAEMIDPGDCRRAIELLGPFGVKDTLIQGGYGLTETTVAATAGQPGTPLRARVLDRTALVGSGHVVDVERDHPQAAEFVSVGHVVRNCEIRVVDERGNPVGTDRIGIVEIRGENVTSGYFENPDADRAAFRHGDWFDSGDVGFMDADGFLTITGRAKEMIIVGGHNYYPWDIEQIAMKAPGAADVLRHVTVCGFWNPSLHREEIVLFFVPERVKDDALAAMLAAVSRHVNAIAGFPIDSFVRLQMRDIPRTSSGKVMRRMLVDRLLDGTHCRMDEPADRATQASPSRRTPDEIRTLLRSLWAEALAIPVTDITPDTSLFHLGCNSLKASQLQGRLEEALGQRLETNFNYAHPILEDQVTLLVARDPSLEAPRDEIELILRTVAHDVLDLPEHEISVTQPLSALAKELAAAARLLSEIGRVFGLSNERMAPLRGGTIRALAKEIRDVTGIGAGASRFPLMNFQETLYFHRKGFVRNEPSKLSCFIFIALELEAKSGGTIDPNTLGDAFHRVIRRHPMMRGVVDESEERPQLRILDQVPRFDVSFRDMSGEDPKKVEAFLTKRGRDLNDVRFEIGEWPLFLCELYRKPGGRYELLFNIDHLLIDGYSFMHLLQEVFATYDEVLGEKTVVLPKSALGFGDYVLIEQARQRTRSYRRAMERQLSLFENLPPKALLPFKADPAAIEDVWFETYYHMLDAGLVARLTARAAQHGVTLNSLLLAVWFKIVNLWSGQDDLVINMPVFNREQYFAGARSVIGTFIDIFPVRVRTGASEPVLDIARKVEGFTRELLSVPVSSIELSRLIAQRDRSSSGSMSSLIFSNSIGVYAGELDALKHLRVKRPMFRTGAPGTFIDLVLYDFEGEYYVNWNYVRDLVDAEFIEQLATQFQDLCKALAEPEDQRGGRFDVAAMLPESFRKVLAANNATAVPFPQATIQDLVADQAAKTPDAIALIDGDVRITYRSLMERANQVAHLLRALGVAQDRTNQTDDLLRSDGVGTADFVAILFERSIDMIVAQLGVLQAGAAYVPIDPEYPRERLGYVIDDCQAKVLLTQSHLVARIPQTTARLDTVIVTDEAAPPANVHEKRRLLGADDIAAMPSTAPDNPAKPEDLAYMIYTSGSTGQPKGVMIPHIGIVNFLEWVRTFHDLSAKDDVALVTSYAFDMTLATNWTPLICGGRIHILHERDTRDVETLLRFLSERKITFLNVTPSHFSLIANAREHLALGDLPMVPDMRIMLGGEVINTKDLNLWLRHYPGHRFVNEYGPTEVSVATAAFPIPVSDKGEITMTTVPIGRPLSNCTAYVLTPCGQPCMPGVAGELCLGGVGVAVGYFNKPDRTAAAFVADPFAGGNARMYRTGDLARIWPDGNIEFLGRRDYQINLRGYRIEAGEVENALVMHPAVSQAVVVAQPDQSGQLQLVAYVVGSGDSPSAELRSFVAQHLPAYMVPAHIVKLASLPTTPSGKLDRKALPTVRGLSARSSVWSRAAATKIERTLLAIWKEVLGFDEIGLDENFWELGGDSLRAMRLIVRYREAGFMAFGLRDVFRYQTILETAAFLDETTRAADTELVTVIRPAQHPRLRLLLLPYACGNASSFMELSRFLSADLEVLAVSPHESWDGDGSDMREMARQVIAGLPDENRGIPLVVAGYSFGGVLACELVSQLERAGAAPHGVVIIAAAPPGASGEVDLILQASDEAILAYSRDVYGFDPGTLSAGELARYLRQLRAQTSAIARYQFDLKTRLRTPALVLVGLDEEDVELRRERQRWHGLFEDCTQDVLPGRHMLIKTHPDVLAGRLLTFFERITTQRPVEAAAE